MGPLAFWIKRIFPHRSGFFILYILLFFLQWNVPPQNFHRSHRFTAEIFALVWLSHILYLDDI